VRHTEREAVGRCSTCGGFYCRECVVDHAGRLVCAGCLGKTTKAAAEGGKPRRRLATLRRAAVFATAVLVLWILFSSIGSLLLSVSPDFHEGTVWHRIGGE
jgi:hypothetical protein